MITTREAINYQYSLIFGYSSPKDMIVGDVIGPGSVTKKRLEELSHEIIKFLGMYNAMLRDYTGSEVFSIEFGLINVEKLYGRESEMKIYPKSMIFVPGRFKDCESLLLALKPDTGYLNTHSSRRSLNNVSQLLFEVEEYIEHPSLNKEEREKILNNFAKRFSNKLYGELLEDKWNKKLIGINTSLPTSKEMLETFSMIESDVDIYLHKQSQEIIIKESNFKKLHPDLKEHLITEHLKYSISEPSALFVIKNTLKLGMDLINLLNQATIDEIQDHLLKYYFNQVKKSFSLENKTCDGNQFIKDFKTAINSISKNLNFFNETSKSFLSSGKKGSINEILESYEHFLNEKFGTDKDKFSEITSLSIKSIKQSFVKRGIVRATELGSAINYFTEIVNNTQKIILNNLGNYLVKRKTIRLMNEIIIELFSFFEREQKPVKILAHKIIEKYRLFLLNEIEISPLVDIVNEFDEKKIFENFRSLVIEQLDQFTEKMTLSIGDLVNFAKIMMQEEVETIKSHLDKFKQFSGELTFLLSYILRHSTVSRFLKKEAEEELNDPVSFSTKFFRFLEKRLGGLNLEWKSYVLEWIKDYSKKFFNALETNSAWTLKDIFDDFLNYLEEREEKEQKSEYFLKIIDEYIAKNSREEDKAIFLDFLQQYEASLEIKTEFPKYVKENIKKKTRSIEFNKELIDINQYLMIDQDVDFYSYVRDKELKYFSKLLPRPVSLILKHDFTDDERESFKENLFHSFDFRYSGTNKIKTEISDNFKEVYREWMKDI